MMGMYLCFLGDHHPVFLANISMSWTSVQSRRLAAGVNTETRPQPSRTKYVIRDLHVER